MEWAMNKKLKVELGGLPQKIHIWSTNTENPILLSLHGGPGGPDRDILRRRCLDLCDAFTLVGWDQRGTGGSYAGCSAESLTLDRLVEDAAELIRWLGKTLGHEKAFILGVSWGTELGTFLALRHPELVAAYVGSGQVVNGIENEDRSWSFALAEAEKAGDTKGVETLKKVGPPVKGIYTPVVDGLLAERKVMSKYGGYRTGKTNFMGTQVKRFLLTPEYGIRDTWGILKGYRFCLGNMWPSIVDYDFAGGHPEPKFAMPYYIFQGVQDRNTPSSLVEGYFERIEAPKKELIWFEHSAHSCLGEEPERFKELLRSRLLG